MSRALICGVGGQDGGYLAKSLLEKGYDVIGTSRDAMATSFSNLVRLGIYERVRTVSMAISDFHSVLTTIKSAAPDEIYNLAGQSSVGLSFDQPVETMESIVTGTLNLLEAIRFVERPIRFYSAGSSECFGNTADRPANEETPFRPRSPYAVAKSAAHGLVVNYREAYGLFACTGILFNHESPLRPYRFVTRKIVSAACRIAKGSKEQLELGRLDIVRDWGWAPEYVEAMWRILQQKEADDFIIATGEANSLEEFVKCAFACLGLDWRDHVVPNSALLRPTDLFWSQGCSAKAERVLGWRASSRMREVVRMMVKGEMSGTDVNL